MSYRVYALIILALAVVFGFFLIYLRPEDKGLKPYGYKGEDEELANPSVDSNKSLNVGLSISASLSCSFRPAPGVVHLRLFGNLLRGLAHQHWSCRLNGLFLVPRT